jgi:hypothetical protein
VLESNDGIGRVQAMREAARVRMSDLASVQGG